MITHPHSIFLRQFPDYHTNQVLRLAQELGEPIPVQHHIAHVAGLAAEHGIDELVGIAADGYGYGTDGAAWGGEVIVWRGGAWERAGSLTPVPMPGGDLATRRPGRMAASYLLAAGLDPAASGLAPDEIEAVRIQVERKLNSPSTTSAGRFLDAVTAWLGIAQARTYEGEPAMRLEAAASGGIAHPEVVKLIQEQLGDYVSVTMKTVPSKHLSESASYDETSAAALDALEGARLVKRYSATLKPAGKTT